MKDGNISVREYDSNITNNAKPPQSSMMQHDSGSVCVIGEEPETHRSNSVVQKMTVVRKNHKYVT